MTDHWDRISESAAWVDPGRELYLPTIVQDICRALLDIRTATTSPSENAARKPRYEFTLDAVTRPDDPYYMTRWGRSRPVTVVAETEQEAINRADALLGDPGGHSHWVFRTVNVREVAHE